MGVANFMIDKGSVMENGDAAPRMRNDGKPRM